jgi:hypothetical protein
MTSSRKFFDDKVDGVFRGDNMAMTRPSSTIADPEKQALSGLG